MTVGELTERDLIARIQAALPPPPGWLPVGIGDDAAVVEPERNRLEVLSVDTLVEGVHFDRAFCPAETIGHRALAVNLSDLAAMGAAPRAVLLSMALPERLPLADFDAMVSGLTALAAQHRAHVIGGNLTRSPGPLMIDVTVTGTVKRRRVLTRAGARTGDGVYVSGTVGAARAGLAQLRASVVSRQSSVDSLSRQSVDLVERYLRPDPRVRLGTLLGRTRAASACIDLSDGLADGVHRIADASGVGIAVDADALPIAAAARAVFASQGHDPIAEALAGGDDYELLFTARRRMNRSVVAAARHAGVSVTRIGECTADRAVVLRRGGADSPVPLTGYTHFGIASPA